MKGFSLIEQLHLGLRNFVNNNTTLQNPFLKLKYLLELFSQNRFIPFEYSSSLDSVHAMSAKYKIVAYLLVAAETAFILFVLYNYGHYLSSSEWESAPVQLIASIVLTSVELTQVLITNWALFQKSDELRRFINVFIKLDSKPGAQIVHLSDFMITIGISYMRALPVFVSVYHSTTSSPENTYAYAGGKSWVGFIIYGFMSGASGYKNCGHMFLFCLLTLRYSVISTSWMEDTRKRAETGDRKVLEMCRLEYRSMQVIHNLFVDAICSMALPLLLMLMTIIGIFSMIAVIILKRLSVGLIFMCIATIILCYTGIVTLIHTCTEATQNSHLLLKALAMRRDRPGGIRWSARCLNVPFGQLFYFKRSTLITTLQFCIQTTITFIFALR